MSKELTIAVGTTGLTVTANVYLLGVVKATGIACAEIGTTGTYAGDFTATPNDPGVYHAAFFSGGTTAIGGGQIVWDGTQEILQTGDSFALANGANGFAATKADTAAILVDTGTTLDARIPAALVAGRMDSSVGAMAANVLTATAINADAITDAKVAADVTIASVTGAVGSVTGAVGSVTGLTASDVGAIKAKTDNLPSDPADQSLIIAATDAITTAIAALPTAAAVGDIPTNAELATALATADDAVLSAVAALNNLSNAQLVAAISAGDDAVLAALVTINGAIADKTGYRLSATGVNDMLRTALTEGYAADGATFTVEQALYMIWSMLADKAIVGTTLTTRKLNGTTAAMSFTLDSGTAPTSQTRAT